MGVDSSNKSTWYSFIMAESSSGGNVKVLFVDDGAVVRRNYRKEVGDLVDTPVSIAKTEHLLENVKYDFILLDHCLDHLEVRKSRLSRHEGDLIGFHNLKGLTGEDIFHNLRGGNYGPLNRETPVRLVSSSPHDYAHSFFPIGGSILERVKEVLKEGK